MGAAMGIRRGWTGPLSICLLAVALGHGAMAQEQLSSSSDVLNCLTPAQAQRQPVEYPALRLERKESASFEVDLLFSRPDRAPAVRLVKEPQPGWVAPESDFLDAVEAYAQQLRVPCLPESQRRATLRQRFEFVPNDGRKVASSSVSDAPGQDMGPSPSCRVEHASLPSYPSTAIRREAQGSVIVAYRFDSATTAPQASIITEPKGSPEFGRGLLANAKNVRLPCFSGEPVTTKVLYVYRLQDAKRVLLRDMTLVQFLSAAPSVPQPAFFDTNTLGCPFAVRVKYYAPHMENTIEELDSSVRARKPFLDWLSRIALKLPEPSANLVLGNEFTLDIPCVKVDL